jgi:hypothetical protein
MCTMGMIEVEKWIIWRKWNDIGGWRGKRAVEHWKWTMWGVVGEGWDGWCMGCSVLSASSLTSDVVHLE